MDLEQAAYLQEQEAEEGLQVLYVIKNLKRREQQNNLIGLGVNTSINYLSNLWFVSYRIWTRVKSC